MTPIPDAKLRELIALEKAAKARPGQYTNSIEEDDFYTAAANLAVPLATEVLALRHTVGEALAASVENIRAREALAKEANVLRAQKDGAYKERDALVCALSKMFPSHLSRHPDSGTTWDNDWRWIVFIELPAGQATWHIHDSELPMFGHLRRSDHNFWDGHTTEEKYRRLEALRAE